MPLFEFPFLECCRTEFVVYMVFLGLSAIVILASFITQFKEPAPYGRHFKTEKAWGPMVPQRLSHILSDFPTGFVLFICVFFAVPPSTKSGPSYAFLGMWLSHYLHRGLLHPLLMRYSAKSTPLGIPLGGFFPNAIFSTFNALHISWAYYSSAWWTDPRFIIGTMLFVFGFLINRAADWKLRSLRKVGEGEGYKIPRGGLFELVSCPNYFGELVEWCGFALASWSPAGLCFALFGASTFIPRALSNHRWYQATFGDAYPTRRKAILPFIM